MAKRYDIQYVSFYTGGSAARKPEILMPQPEKSVPVSAPKARPRKQTVIRVDPLALISIAVSVVMLVLMGVGVMRLQTAHEREAKMMAYVENLQAENSALREKFNENYDPAAVKEMALALGMVPVEQVTHKTIRVEPMVEEAAEPTLWEQVQAFFDGLFA